MTGPGGCSAFALALRRLPPSALSQIQSYLSIDSFVSSPIIRRHVVTPTRASTSTPSRPLSSSSSSSSSSHSPISARPRTGGSSSGRPSSSASSSRGPAHDIRSLGRIPFDIWKEWTSLQGRFPSGGLAQIGMGLSPTFLSRLKDIKRTRKVVDEAIACEEWTHAESSARVALDKLADLLRSVPSTSDAHASNSASSQRSRSTPGSSSSTSSQSRQSLSADLRSIASETYLILETFLTPTSCQQYTRLLTVANAHGLLLPTIKGKVHLLNFASMAIRHSTHGWNELFLKVVRSPGASPVKRDHVGRVIHALLTHGAFSNRPEVITGFWRKELEHVGVEESAKWSLSTWQLLAWAYKPSDADTYRRRRKLSQSLHLYLSSVKEAQPSREWTKDEVFWICGVHEDALRTWNSQLGHRTMKTGSPVPSSTTQQLLDIIGSPRSLSTEYINVWMKAERIAERYDVAELAWQLFDPGPHSDTWSSTGITQNGSLSHFPFGPTPDADTWREYWTLRKEMLTKNGSMAPLESLVRRMFESVPIEHLDAGALNALLALLVHHGHFDLEARPDAPSPIYSFPMILLLLRKYDWDPRQEYGPAPDKRTIFLAAAGLIRLWNTADHGYDQLFGWSNARLTRTILSEGYNRSRGQIHLAERRMITETLMELIPHDPEYLQGVSREDLQKYLITSGVPPHISNRKNDYSPKTSAGSAAAETRGEAGARARMSSPEGGEGSLTPAHLLLRPMLHLYENAIRIHLSERPELQSDAEVQAAFDRIMKRVYEEVHPVT